MAYHEWNWKRLKRIMQLTNFKNGEQAAEIEIQDRGLDLELWNVFIENPKDFDTMFS